MPELRIRDFRRSEESRNHGIVERPDPGAGREKVGHLGSSASRIEADRPKLPEPGDRWLDADSIPQSSGKEHQGSPLLAACFIPHQGSVSIGVDAAT